MIRNYSPTCDIVKATYIVQTLRVMLKLIVNPKYKKKENKIAGWIKSILCIYTYLDLDASSCYKRSCLTYALMVQSFFRWWKWQRISRWDSLHQKKFIDIKIDLFSWSKSISIKIFSIIKIQRFSLSFFKLKTEK